MSDEFINRFKIENSWYKTKYVILALGTNNYLDVEKYKKYMLQAISILRNNGQIPVYSQSLLVRIVTMSLLN